MVALYVHFSKQLERILHTLERKRRYIEGMGWEQYNQAVTTRYIRPA
jgi:hypothetical protein